MRTIPRRTGITVAFLCIVCVGARLVTAPSFKAGERLPNQISDDAFWQMVSDFSEEGGYFRFENFLSNELAFQFVVPVLKESIKPGGAYLGVGPEQNFTYLVALQPKIAFIIDIRRQNMLELLMYKALFDISPDRAEFLSRLFSRKQPASLDAASSADALFKAYGTADPDPQLFKQNLQLIKEVLLKKHKFGLTKDDEERIDYVYQVFYEAGPDLDYSSGGFPGGRGTPTYAELMTASDEKGKNWSYLATEENFRILRDMQMKNIIVPLVGDFAGPRAIRNVGQYLTEHDATVSIFYTSNVEQYLFQQGDDWRRFYSNVATLPTDSSSTFIRSVNGGNYYQPRGYAMRFMSVLGSIPDFIQAFRDGRVRYYSDVIQMSR
jgi:hypothetical protein